MTDAPRERLLLIVGRRDLAWHQVAKALRPGLEERYEVEILHESDYPNRAALIIDTLCRRDAHHVHFFWRETALTALARPWKLLPDFQQQGISIDNYAAQLAQRTITASITDHLFLEPKAVARRQVGFAALDGYSTGSWRLEKNYTERYHAAPLMTLPNGVDTRHFSPSKSQRLARLPERPLVLGWVGNPAWMEQKSPDHKGFRQIIQPALEQLRAEGLAIETSFAGQGLNWLAHEKMPGFYAGIDLLLCASRSESTPNPVLEAMACGVPVISTPVGIVREVFGPGQQDLLLPERSATALAAKIRRIHHAPEQLPALGKENRDQARQHDWRSRHPLWLSFFSLAAERARARRDLKRAMIQKTFEQQQRLQTLQQEHSRWPRRDKH